MSDDTVPPAQGGDEISDVVLSHNDRQYELDKTRIRLFTHVFYAALIVLIVLLVLIWCILTTYLCLLKNNPLLIPPNFWHIPLIVALMFTSVLGTVLILTAKFGDPDKGTKNSTGNIGIDELLDIIKNLTNKE